MADMEIADMTPLRKARREFLKRVRSEPDLSPELERQGVFVRCAICNGYSALWRVAMQVSKANLKTQIEGEDKEL